MEKIWLKSYPPGVPEDIDPGKFNSLKEIFEQSFEEHRTKPAYINMGTVLSYDDLDRLSAEFGAWLQQRAELRRGDRIAIMLPNVLQYPIAIVRRAARRLTSSTPIRCTPRASFEHQLKDSGATAIVILENFAHILEEVIGRHAM